MPPIFSLPLLLGLSLSFTPLGWGSQTSTSNLPSNLPVPPLHLTPDPQLAIFGLGRPRPSREEEERKRTQVVTVTNAKLVSENIGGSWFHTLTGSVENRTPNPVQTVTVHYEIVGASGQLTDAGSLRVETGLLPTGERVEFTTSTPKAAGQVRVTLVEWLNLDRSYGSFPQRQLFANP
jgi:hypothetical protein